MTIATSARTVGPYTGTGAVSVYPFSFKVFQGSDLLVTSTDTVGVISTLVLSSGYSVTLNADQDVSPGGTVNLTAALPSGYRLNISSAVPATQPVSLTNGGGFFPKVIEGALDRLTILLQQLGVVGVVQALRVPEIGGTPTLPAAAARAGKLLGFDSNGDPAAIASASQDASSLALALLGQTGASQIGFIQSGAGAVATTVQAKLRERVSLVDFGAVLNDSSSAAKIANTAALLAAINAFPEQSTASLDPAYSNAGTIEFAPGTYWFNAKLEIKRNIRLRGLGGYPSGNSFGAVRLVFPDGDHGIIIHSYVTSGTGRGADGTVLEALSVIPASYAGSGSTPAAGSYHGVWVRTRAHLRGVQSSGWPGNGIQVVATAGDGGTLEGNANNWSGDCLVTQQNGMNGLFVSGADVNASYVCGVDSRANRRCGVRDNSFLGVTIDAAHTSSNGSAGLVSYGGKNWYCLSDTLGGATTPGTDATVWGDMGAPGTFTAWSSGGSYFIGLPYYVENPNARTTLDGAYSEGGQGASVIKLPAQVFGGLHAAGNSNGFGFDPTLSTAPFWDTDVAGAVLRFAHLVPSKGLNFAAAKMIRSADADTLDAYTEAITHTPTGTGITTTGTPIYTWQGTRIGNRVDFRITIGVSGGTNAFTANTTYVSLPAALAPSVSGVCVACTNTVDQVGLCMIDSTGRLYLPTWAASNKTVIVSGTYFVSSTAA